jgi:hypothetical protein
MDNYNAPGLDLNIAYDNGYLLSGWIIPNYPPYTWLIKTDANGNVLWEKFIGSGNNSTTAVAYICQNFIGEIYLCGGVMEDGDSNPMIIMSCPKIGLHKKV